MQSLEANIAARMARHFKGLDNDPRRADEPLAHSILRKSPVQAYHLTPARARQSPDWLFRKPKAFSF